MKHEGTLDAWQRTVLQHTFSFSPTEIARIIEALEYSGTMQLSRRNKELAEEIREAVK